MKTSAAAMVALLAMAAPGAQAAELVGLAKGNWLVPIDSATGQAGTPIKATGLAGSLIGIDQRPANGMLYGVTDGGGIYTLDPRTGAATMVSTLDKPYPKGGVAIVDFNPAADRLRLMNSDGTSLRVNVDTGQAVVDGKLNHDPAGARAGKKAMVVAGAYTNSVAGTQATTLYDIEGGEGLLMQQAPPNDGVLKPVAKLSMPLKSAAFDIATAGTVNTAIIVAGGAIHTLDLTSGELKKGAVIKGFKDTLMDVAVVKP